MLAFLIKLKFKKWDSDTPSLLKAIMNETPKNNRGWRILRRLFIGAAVVATVIGLLVTEENWRGKRAWENYQREWTAKGEKFDWQSFVPASVPDDQNFFTSAIFTNIQNGKIKFTPYGNDGGPDFRPDLSQGGYAIFGMQMTDLSGWQNYYRHQTNADMLKSFPISQRIQTPAADVLLALSQFDSAVEALRQASQLPYANIPLAYEDGFHAPLLPRLADLKRCSLLMLLRSSAELADGQNDKALADVKLLLFLGNNLRTSPFLISCLVRIAIVNIAMHPIWEGLVRHQWSDAQLIALDAELAQMDFIADYGFAMRGERAFALASFEDERRTREQISIDDRGVKATNKLTLMPSAYFYQNELNFAHMHQQWVLPLVDTNARIISRESLRRANAAADAGLKHYSPYKIQALMIYPAIGNAVKKFALVQTSINLARIACTLERYHLAHGEYPETLDVLTPKFIAALPRDIINGQPLHYRREVNGQFILYSVGWNETDDDGKVVLTKGGSVDRDQGDWVWQYPVK